MPMNFISLVKKSFRLFNNIKKPPTPTLEPKRKILFIINPISGTGKKWQIESQIERHLSKQQFQYMITYTKGPMHAKILAKKASEEGFDIVVAVGGDGSVNEVAQGLIGTQTTLGIIPTGSGNGLARHLNIPINYKRAISCLNKFKIRSIDTVQINDENFINLAGIGFDAKVSLEFSKFRRRGLFSYLQIILQQFPTYKPQKYTFLIDGKTYTQEAFLICLANSGQYGNNIYIAPQAKIDDGYIDMLIFRKFPTQATPKILFDLINKRIDNSPYIETIRCKEVIFENPPAPFHLDGEPRHIKGTVSITIKPSSLRVIYQERVIFSTWTLKSLMSLFSLSKADASLS